MIKAILISTLLGTVLVDKIHDPMIDDGSIMAPMIIRVDGKINELSANRFEEEIFKAQRTGQNIIPVIINSYGGDVYALFQMIDAINKVKKKIPVATIIMGKAMSSGAALFSAGTEGMRYIAPNATIMIHEVSSSVSGKVNEIKSDAGETDRLNKLMLETISINIGKPRGYITHMVHTRAHADWYITAKQALKHNLANKIGIPDLVIKAKVTITLE